MLERQEGSVLSACRVVFGAEPSDQEVYAFLLANWEQLRFGPPVRGKVRSLLPGNPKRRAREAGKASRASGIGTKAQQALKQQQEEAKVERKASTKARREAETERKRALGRAKKKEKHKGH